MTENWKVSREHFNYVTDRDWQTIEDKHLQYTLEAQNGIVELIFQCTDEDKDWFTNLDYYPVKMQEVFGEDTNIYGHEGFYTMYLGIRKDFIDLCNALGNNLKEIRISGFSLGGGLTKLAFADAVKHFGNKGISIHGIAYEGPRVFCVSRELRKLLKKYKKNCKLEYVWTFWDPVVHCPPALAQAIPFIEVYFYPFKVKFNPYRSGFSVWKEYGTKVKIGKWNRIKPTQHSKDEIRQNLFDKLGC